MCMCMTCVQFVTVKQHRSSDNVTLTFSNINCQYHTDGYGLCDKFQPVAAASFYFVI